MIITIDGTVLRNNGYGNAYKLESVIYILGITMKGGSPLWFGVVSKDFILLFIYISRPTFLNIKGSEKLKFTPSTHSLMVD